MCCAIRRATRPADLQRATAGLSADWKLRKLVDIDDVEARDDLARLSATMISIVAQAARGPGLDAVPEDVVEQGETAAERFLLRWRGEADPADVKAVDTYWVCTAEHGLNASTFTARIVASTGADCGAAMSAAVGALSGPLHGGAPARVLPMLDEVAAMGDPERYVNDLLTAASGSWASATASTAPRTRARDCSGARRGARVAARRGRGRAERVALEELAVELGPAAPDQRRVLVRRRLDVAEIPPRSPRDVRLRSASPAGRRTSSSRSAPVG